MKDNKFNWILWVGGEVVLEATNKQRLVTEIDLNYDKYDDAVIENTTTKDIFQYNPKTREIK